MITTIKLPIQNKIDVTDLLREFNSCVRFCYNRIKKDDLSERQLRTLLKANQYFKLLDAWLTQCAIREAASWFKKSPDIVFGGKKNLALRSAGKLTKDEW